MSEPAEEVRRDEFLRQVDEEMTQIAVMDEGRYETGSRLRALGMEAAVDEAVRSIAYPMWLIWGCLTDMVDGRRADPEKAFLLTRRAALEWLDARRLQLELKSYLDRWVFLECGYERPPSESRENHQQ